ncbi:MAG: acyl-ACP desaturase [Acidimicrobiia bacterium]
MDDVALRTELEPLAGELFDRHLGTAREWFPHQLVPWDRGRAFEADDDWDPDDAHVGEAARSALFVNLLTEDNLPYYTRTLSGLFGRDDAWGAWTRRWTAEEGRHAIVIRDYLTVTRAIDPVALERGRMKQVSNGIVPEPLSLPDALVYVTLQELATRIAHQNTGKILEDKAGQRIMSRVAGDENLHYRFYRDVATRALELEPTRMLDAMDRQVRDFAMPGTGIPDFPHHARAIANAGVYDMAAHHDQILVPVLMKHWGVERLQGLKAAGEQARERLLAHVDRVGRVGRRLLERRGLTPAL